jgi:hypothetical protein
MQELKTENSECKRPDFDVGFGFRSVQLYYSSIDIILYPI